MTSVAIAFFQNRIGSCNGGTTSCRYRASRREMILLVGAMSGVIFGWSAATVPQGTTLTQAEQTGNLFAGYGLDVLGDAPDGSLAGSYLALLDGRNGEGR